jgi:hypothetical protein
MLASLSTFGSLNILQFREIGAVQLYSICRPFLKRMEEVGAMSEVIIVWLSLLR